MYKEYKTMYMYSGNGCKIGECDGIKYTAAPCPKKPTSGIRHYLDYKMIPAGDQTKVDTVMATKTQAPTPA
ncbi:predicted protein [Uncinocarpus reesii 1704]|uniref:Uncharacterized protein n=1 Tax=Uncinocarpus reesii (strain UAMH 1704) TaxID=336963 RepID=C4JKJ1_UNCRE|nr:uncharacterized protein UREG_02148 [Uncinocarpus reesii 1704]EEP77299.1 predicted protein [Uncinocarpus reesii 1704]